MSDTQWGALVIGCETQSMEKNSRWVYFISMRVFIRGGGKRQNDGGELVDDIDEINCPNLGVDVVEREREGGQECDQPMLVLVEDSSDEEGGEAAIDGDNDDWGPRDDA